MAKGTETAPSTPKDIKPSLRVDVSPGMTLPKLGDKVTISATGTVISVGSSKDRWENKAKPKSYIEIEYTGFDDIAVTKGNRKRTKDELERENPRV